LPDDGKRKLLIQGLVTQIQTATGGPDYFYDYSGADVVDVVKDTLEERIQKTSDVAIRIRDGSDTTVFKVGETTSFFNIEVQVTVKAEESALLYALQDVLADLSRVIGKNPTLGGTCTSARIGSTERSQYTFTNRSAVTTVIVACEYDFQPGVTT
jgi:hypothetical protein